MTAAAIPQPLARAIAQAGLDPIGGFALTKDDGFPDIYKSLILLGPSASDFWPIFNGSPEAADGLPDPIDRWSTRVCTALAAASDARALFPFGATPALPFISWALRTGQIHVSAAQLLIHPRAGLWVSFRAALLIRDATDFGPPAPSPCDSCATRPCLSACPVAAINAGGYDVPSCHAHLDQPAGAACMDGGCLVRQSCPISQSFGRLPAQSAHHMRYFHP